MLEDSELDAYYSQAYGHIGERMFQGQQVNARVNNLLMQRFKLTDIGASFLDVGCGFGFLMHGMRDRFGMQTTGVELANAERNFGKDELGLDIRGNISALDDTKFDIVGLFEVIEHIADPVSFTRQVTERLKPGGQLVIATDNFDCEVVKTMGDRFSKWIPHQHISLFNDRTLPQLIGKVGGLKITKMASFTPWELLVQKYLAKATNGRHGGKDFNLEAEMKSEGIRPYRLFALRRLINSAWFTTTLRSDLKGEMMIISAAKDKLTQVPS